MPRKNPGCRTKRSEYVRRLLSIAVYLSNEIFRRILSLVHLMTRIGTRRLSTNAVSNATSLCSKRVMPLKLARKVLLFLGDRKLVSLWLGPYTLAQRSFCWMMFQLLQSSSFLQCFISRADLIGSVHTSKWIVDRCFTGDLMEGRTLILVVRSLSLLCFPSNS